MLYAKWKRIEPLLYKKNSEDELTITPRVWVFVQLVLFVVYSVDPDKFPVYLIFDESFEYSMVSYMKK